MAEEEAGRQDAKAWRATAFVCGDCGRIGVNVALACDSPEGGDTVEKVGDDWRALAYEVVTEMMRRTRRPAGGVSCCILVTGLAGPHFNDLAQREASGDEAASDELFEATEANIVMEDEIGRILQTIADGEDAPRLT